MMIVNIDFIASFFDIEKEYFIKNREKNDYSYFLQQKKLTQNRRFNYL